MVAAVDQVVDAPLMVVVAQRYFPAPLPLYNIARRSTITMCFSYLWERCTLKMHKDIDKRLGRFLRCLTNR